MLLIFVRICRVSIFLDCPPRILGGFTWRLQKEPPISNSKIGCVGFSRCIIFYYVFRYMMCLGVFEKSKTIWGGGSSRLPLTAKYRFCGVTHDMYRKYDGQVKCREGLDYYSSDPDGRYIAPPSSFVFSIH